MFHIKVWYVHVLSAHLIERDAKIKPFASKGSLRFCEVVLSPEPDIILKNYRELVWSVDFDFQPIRRHGRNMFLTQLG